MTYRFANEPENNNVQRKIYTGKVQIQFRNDGYSDILLSDSNAAISSGGGDNNNLSFEKVWGWDVEVVPSSTSNSDEVIDEEKKVDMEYLLFSADFKLPSPISKMERFYFQANVNKQGGRTNNKSSCGSILLTDGSVTVKRNIPGPGGGKGWWGVFGGADSILAQFRQVGEFKCWNYYKKICSVRPVCDHTGPMFHVLGDECSIPLFSPRYSFSINLHKAEHGHVSRAMLIPPSKSGLTNTGD